MSIRSSRRSLYTLGSLALAATMMAACGTADADSDSDTAGTEEEVGTTDNPVRIGVVGASDPQWEVFSDVAEENGIYVEIEDFAEYTLPNPALTDGDLHLNQFQHILYLAQYNDSADEDLVPIGATAVYPLGVYSTEFDSTDDIPDGSQVAIPNDVTNQARALFVLEEAGLLTLDDNGGVVPTPLNIVEEESSVTVEAMDAHQTVVALDSVAASVVNNDFVADAGLSPADAIFEDSAESEGARPYINILVARSGEADNPVYQELAELLHHDSVEEALDENSGGTASFAHHEADELQEILAEVLESLEAQE